MKKERKKGFSVMVGDKYVKRTSRFGAFHGCMTFTEYPEEARVWSRESDAKYTVGTIQYRAKTFPRDREKVTGAIHVVEEPI